MYKVLSYLGMTLFELVCLCFYPFVIFIEACELLIGGFVNGCWNFFKQNWLSLFALSLFLITAFFIYFVSVGMYSNDFLGALIFMYMVYGVIKLVRHSKMMG